MDYRCLWHGLKTLKIKVFPLRSTGWFTGFKGATGWFLLNGDVIVILSYLFCLSKVSSVHKHPLNMHQLVFIPVFVFPVLFWEFVLLRRPFASSRLVCSASTGFTCSLLTCPPFCIRVCVFPFVFAFKSKPPLVFLPSDLFLFQRPVTFS